MRKWYDPVTNTSIAIARQNHKSPIHKKLFHKLIQILVIIYLSPWMRRLYNRPHLRAEVQSLLKSVAPLQEVSNRNLSNYNMRCALGFRCASETSLFATVAHAAAPLSCVGSNNMWVLRVFLSFSLNTMYNSLILHLLLLCPCSYVDSGLHYYHSSHLFRSHLLWHVYSDPASVLAVSDPLDTSCGGVLWMIRIVMSPTGY